MDPFTLIAIMIVLMILSALMRPKVKAPTPAASQELDSPVADAGKPVGVIFGTITITSPNVLWYGDKIKDDYQVDA